MFVVRFASARVFGSLDDAMRFFVDKGCVEKNGVWVNSRGWRYRLEERDGGAVVFVG